MVAFKLVNYNVKDVIINISLAYASDEEKSEIGAMTSRTPGGCSIPLSYDPGVLSKILDRGVPRRFLNPDPI